MNAAEIEELLTKLVQIPAPTGREQKRAEYITDWLKELGYHPFTDAAGNVIVEMKVQEGRCRHFCSKKCKHPECARNWR